MAKKEAYTYTIPTWMASYLINGDVGDLSETEIETADEFAKDVRKEHGNANFIPANDSESYFAMPDVGGLFADCMDVVIIES